VTSTPSPSEILVNGRPNFGGIVRLAKSIRADIFPSDGPLDLDLLSSRWQCEVVPSYGLSHGLPAFSLGLLIPQADESHRFRVVYNSELPSRLRRLTIAHELVHTLFYSRTGVPTRLSKTGSKEEESFCDRLAEELLLPSSTTSHLTNLADVRSIADEYQVPYDLVTNRYFWTGDHMWDLIAALRWDKGRRRTHRSGTFRIQWHLAWQSSAVRDGMPVFSPQLHRALVSGSHVSATEPIKVNGRSLGVHHSALGLDDGSILVGVSHEGASGSRTLLQPLSSQP
jgi:hypothetical protein